MRWAVISCVMLGVAACGFDVNVGYTRFPTLVAGGSGSDAGTGGGGGAVLPGCDAPAIVAYDITVPAARLSASCFRSDAGVDGGVMLPQLNFSAFIVTPTRAWWDVAVERVPTIALRGLSSQELGDAPAIKIPGAFAGQNNAFTWSESVSVRTQLDGPGRMHLAVGSISIDRLDTPFTGGTFELSSVWACDPAADGGCPPRQPDDVSCSSARSFTAQKIAMDPAWLPETPATVDGGTRWLVSLDVGQLQNAEQNCQGGAPLLVQKHADGVRSLETWVRQGETLFLPVRTWSMADSPPLTVGPTIVGGYGEQTTTVETTMGALETHVHGMGLATLPTKTLSCSTVGNDSSVATALFVRSAWYCAGVNCPLVTSRSSCAAALQFEVLPLDVPAP